MVETRDSGGRSIEKQARIPSQITVRLALLLLLSVTVEQLYKPATNVLTCNQALAGLLYLMLQSHLQLLPVTVTSDTGNVTKTPVTVSCYTLPRSVPLSPRGQGPPPDPRKDRCEPPSFAEWAPRAASRRTTRRCRRASMTARAPTSSAWPSSCSSAEASVAWASGRSGMAT